MTISRKGFLAAAAVATSAAAVANVVPANAADNTAPAAAMPAPSGRAPLHFHVLKPNEYDHAAMNRVLTVSNPHKQVFESVNPLVIAPQIASVYIHMQNAMNAYEFSLGKGSLATHAVLIGPSIVFALNDNMWKKYNIGAALNIDATNTYYRANSLVAGGGPDDPNSIYQDWSAQAELKRGGAFMVCHNATTAVAGMLGAKAGVAPADALADFKANMLPGFMLVPAGVAAVQLAQENGWKLYTIV